ncbi:hypothetical protein ACF08N_10840 [Streptomyces sp. NPDC015127]|uniref:hypothetical protein n=1 Tax=Streptomyces sp. NPDC015127 TaxID=3364939 RepID=UPI0036FE4174
MSLAQPPQEIGVVRGVPRRHGVDALALGVEEVAGGLGEEVLDADAAGVGQVPDGLLLGSVRPTVNSSFRCMP